MASKLRINRTYSVIPNALVNSPDISLRAKGLFAYLQGKPDGWNFSADRIKWETVEGRDAIRKALQELEQFWYLKRLKFQNAEWKWEWEYVLFEQPEAEKPSTEEPTTEMPTTETPPAENQPINKTINNKQLKEKNNKQEIIKAYDENILKIANTFLKIHQENETKQFLYKLEKKWKENIINDFCEHIEKLIRIDKLSEFQINKMIWYLRYTSNKYTWKKGFCWIDQIQTPAKLRQKKDDVPYFITILANAENFTLPNNQYDEWIEDVSEEW